MIKFRNNRKKHHKSKEIKKDDPEPSEEKLFWSHEDMPNDISILLRNLSSSSLISVKKLFDIQLDKESDHVLNTSRQKQKPAKKTKKANKTKKEMIIEASRKKRQEKEYASDQEKYSIFKREDDPNFEEWLPRFKTDSIREKVKLNAIKKEKDPQRKLELYLHIDPSLLNERDLKSYQKYHKQYHDKPLKRYQLKCLGSRLPPLDTFNPKQFKLDDWQMDVIRKVIAGDSVLVCAPTSSGKTILTTYFANTNKKVLYVVPSKPLAFQVAASFQQQSNEEVAIIVDDMSYFPSVNYSTIVATPYELENKLPYLSDFLQSSNCFAIFDEVHNLNGTYGDAYERVMKWLHIPFLALSATIENPHEIKNWLEHIHPGRLIHVVQYKKRFINIQRNLWDMTPEKNPKLIKLHPLACLTIMDFQKDHLPVLPFTPWDCYSTWSSIKNVDNLSPLIQEEVSRLDPENYFNEKRLIHLDDVRNYEHHLKKLLCLLDTQTIDNLLSQYHVDEADVSNKDWDLLELMESIRDQDMFPCIAFQENSSYAREMYYQLVDKLEKNEALYYPFHYSDAEFKQTMYDSYMERRQKLIEETKSMDIEAVLMRFDEKELNVYQNQITHRYKSNIIKIKKDIKNGSIQACVGEKILSNLEKEYKLVLNSNSILPTDQFEKHKDYCLTYPPMSADSIRNIRRHIINKTNIKIDYTHPLLQGLKRGVGLYEKGLPDAYLQIVQKLAQSKELSVVISDSSLALGIHMPFKSTLVTGWKDSTQLDSMLFQQMSGRAGRRGHDTEGHVIFANLSWKSLMKVGFQKVVGNPHLPKHYNIVEQIPGYCLKAYKNVYKVSLSEFGQEIKDIQSIDMEDVSGLENFENKLIWKLRRHETGIVSLVKAGNQLNLIYKKQSLGLQETRKVLTFIFDCIILGNDLDIFEYQSEDSTLNQIFVLQKLPDDLSKKDRIYWIGIVKQLGDITKIFHNTIQSEDMKNLKRLYKQCFEQCRHIMSKCILI